MLKTVFGFAELPFAAGFQSLIGMLKTECLFIYARWQPVFQSLIGMLKTHQVFAGIASQLFVSIPHRYAENQFIPQNSYPILHVKEQLPLFDPTDNK